jgi:hypothetical protein
VIFIQKVPGLNLGGSSSWIFSVQTGTAALNKAILLPFLSSKFPSHTAVYGKKKSVADAMSLTNVGIRNNRITQIRLYDTEGPSSILAEPSIMYPSLMCVFKSSLYMFLKLGKNKCI